MSLQDILTKLVKNAEEQAIEIDRQSQLEIEAIKKDLEQEGQKSQNALVVDTDLKIEKAIKKSESLAKMAGNNRVLQEKQDFICLVLTAVEDKLACMPAKDYEIFLTSLIKEISFNEGVVYPAKGKENSTKGAIKNSKKQFKIGESKDISGGFVLETDNIDIDYSFNNLVHNIYAKELEDIIIKDINV